MASKLVSRKSNIPWLEKPQSNFFDHSCNSPISPQVQLLGGDGFSITLPLPLLLASSALFRAALSNHQCCGSVSISVPSVGGGTLVLVGEILRRGVTSSLDGDDGAKENLKSVQAVLDMLLCGVKLSLQKNNQFHGKSVEIGEVNESKSKALIQDVNSNIVQSVISSPAVSSPSTAGSSCSAIPSYPVTSPSNSTSSSITLSPSENSVKEETGDSDSADSKVLYIDVCLEDILSSPKNDCEIVSPSFKRVKREIKVECEEVKVLILCPFCQREFKAQKSLKQHISLIHPEPTHDCTKCDASFFKKSSLKKHVNSTHLKFPCRSCSMSFITKSKLGHHAERAHKDIITKLPKCDLKVSSKRKLEKHTEVIHSDERYCCNICSKIFKSKESFIKHCELLNHDSKLVTKFKLPDNFKL